MAEVPQGYQAIPEEDRKKAQAFFDRGKTVADTGNYDYAIEMYLQGLAIDPDSVEAHKALREISLKRKASGGKDLGMFEKMKLKRGGRDEKQNMLNCEKMLAYDPGNTDLMLCILQNAFKAGYYDTVMWVGPIVQKANTDSGKPDFSKFIVLKDTYKALGRWKLAADACQLAVNLRPDDMDLGTELKHLGATQTMDAGNYEAGDFRKSIRDPNKQRRLLEEDKDVRSVDSMTRAIQDAEAEYTADPNETGKLMKLVDALVRTENAENEARAMDLLQQTFERTRQFRFRHAIGRIRLGQLAREDRALVSELKAKPADEAIKRRYAEFRRARFEEELTEYTLWSENYPTDMKFKYEMALRMFALEKYNESIPVLQQARTDPKYRSEAAIYLARAFLAIGFVEESADTLRSAIEEYEVKGDARAKELYYWFGRALEQKKDPAGALKCFSQVAQWDFNYRDVQARIKRLRSEGQ